MAVGASILGTTADGLLFGLSGFIPTSNYEGKYTTLKIPLSEVGSEEVLNIYELIDYTTDKYYKGHIDKDTFGKILQISYEDALRKVNITNGYDLINRAIMEFNLGDFDKSSNSIIFASSHFEVKSYINYHKALLSLAKDIDTNKAIEFLQESIAEANDILNP